MSDVHSTGALRQQPEAVDQDRALLEPVALSDERIDHIADLVVKGMPDGLRGFCREWGWRQFARALLADCRGHFSASADFPEPPQAASGSHQELGRMNKDAQLVQLAESLGGEST